MNNKIGGFVTKSMIALSSLTACENAPKTAKTLEHYMANRPVKEYRAITSNIRKNYAQAADEQHALDSVAFTRLLQKTYMANDSQKVKEFNNIAKQTKLKNANTYADAFNELDEKMVSANITNNEFKNNKKEYSKYQLNLQQNLRLRQFKLDSLRYGQFFEQNSKYNWSLMGEFKNTAKEIKPQ